MYGGTPPLSLLIIVDGVFSGNFAVRAALAKSVTKAYVKFTWINRIG